MTTDPPGPPSDLETGLQLEELLAELASRFLNRSTAEDVGEEIERAQRRLRDLLGFQRLTLWQEDASSGTMQLLRIVQPEHVPDPAPGMDAATLFPYATEQIRRGQALVWGSLEDLPPEASRDVESFRYFGTTSSAVLPLRAGGRVIGAVSFATVGTPRSWSATELRRLELVAQVFASALFRSNADAALRDIRGRLISAQERERARLAQELHDGISQQLAVLAVELQLLGLRPPASAEELQARLDQLTAKTRALSTDVHRLAHGLHPAKLERLGLVAAIGGFCRELDAAEPVSVRFTPRNVPEPIPGDVALCLYRVTQEALWNVVKHSGAQNASVMLAGGASELTLDVIDDGAGFVPQRIASAASLGMLGMRERVGMHGGEIQWEAVPGGGTAVHVRVPLPPPDPAA